jgi:succinoglycan biosynthesis transport protein ExoP
LHPSGPKRMQIISLASAVGVVVAVLCALVLDRFRSGFFSSVDLEAATGLTVVGIIPRLRRGMEKLSPRKTQFLFREAVSHVRATLEFGDHHYRARVVLVTSALPREGKTHFATSLARSVAARGGRALLIECDRPRPSVPTPQKPLGGDNALVSPGSPARSGVSNLTIAVGVIPGLDVATLQTTESHPSVFPSLNRARDEVDAARQVYDLIVLDGPPVLACAEAELLCGVVDGLIMIVRWGRTSKGAVLSAMRILRIYGIRTIGAVMTNVDIKQLTKSGAGHGGLYRRYVE